MATHASAEKAARQSIKRAARNVSVLSECRTAVKKVRSAVAEAKNKAEAKTTLIPLLNEAQSLLMSTAKKGVLRSTTASRYVSRLSKLVHQATT